ncbi:MAG: putative 2-aminoethylphosphonate ABC transporter permease subunit, partial [Proteobacteria bacterium]
RAVPLNPKPNKTVDTSYFIFCGLIAIFIIGMLGMSQFAALIKFWPYNLSVSLQNYRFDMMQGAGWRAFTNSIKLSSWTAIIGTCVIFFGAYLYEKTSRFEFGKQVLNMLVLMPLAVPGMVLGLAYILFFNQPNNPLNFIYATMSIMVLNTIVHYYTVVHLTSVTALKQMDPEFESIAVSLKSPFYRTFAKVTAPVCLPTILNIAIYLFMAAMTSVSGLIFLYSGDTPIASISVLNMEDDGNIAGAAAMAMMIFYASTMARILHSLVSRFVLRHSQAWRSRT